MPEVWPNRKTSGSQRLFEAVDAMHWKQVCSHWRRGLAPNGAKGAQEPKRRQTEGKFQTGAKQHLDSAFPAETWPGAKRLALAPKAPNAPNDCAKRAKAPNRRQTEGRRQTGAKQPCSQPTSLLYFGSLAQRGARMMEPGDGLRGVAPRTASVGCCNMVPTAPKH